MALLTAACATFLATIHLFVGRLRFLDVIPRSRWLSIAGGISVSYVFIHVLPELMEHQINLNARTTSRLEVEIFLATLVGLVVFYALERMAVRSKQQQPTDEEVKQTPAGVFAIHIGSFALYNSIIGYLLVHRETETLLSLAIYVFALGLHFVVNDYSLRQHHQEKYTAVGRWVLAGAVMLGWLAGILTEINATALAFLFAFLSGGVILNTLKEELPENRESRLEAFVLGAAGFTVLLLLV